MKHDEWHEYTVIKAMHWTKEDWEDYIQPVLPWAFWAYEFSTWPNILISITEPFVLGSQRISGSVLADECDDDECFIVETQRDAIVADIERAWGDADRSEKSIVTLLGVWQCELHQEPDTWVGPGEKEVVVDYRGAVDVCDERVASSISRRFACVIRDALKTQSGPEAVRHLFEMAMLQIEPQNE